jgi:glycosyltransferase involved in cell wall biosynthesis
MTNIAAINHNKDNCVKLFSENIYSRINVDRFDIPENSLPLFSESYSKLREIPSMVRGIEKEYDTVLVPTYLLMPGLNPENYNLDIVPIVHDLEIIKHKRNPLQNHVLNIIMRNLGKCDKVIAVSEFTKIDLISAGIQEEKISVIIQGIDRDRIYPESRDSDVPVNENSILYIGSLVDRKNPKFLIDVLYNLNKKYSLAIGGKSYNGDNKKGLIRYAKEKGVFDRVRFTGYLSTGELRAAYSEAGIYLHPAYFEGYGRTPIEAATCGTVPLLYKNIPSAKQIDKAVTFEGFNPEAVAKLLKENIGKEIQFTPVEWNTTAKKIKTVVTSGKKIN